MADIGTISHASISENVHSIVMYNVYLYQFWCFYQKVNNWFGMPLHYMEPLQGKRVATDEVHVYVLATSMPRMVLDNLTDASDYWTMTDKVRAKCY